MTHFILAPPTSQQMEGLLHRLRHPVTGVPKAAQTIEAQWTRAHDQYLTILDPTKQGAIADQMMAKELATAAILDQVGKFPEFQAYLG